MSRIVVLGDLNLDVHARQPATLLPGDEARDRLHAAPGGSAGTFARTAAAHGASVAFLGCVGTDLIGDLLIRSLTDAGVDTYVQRAAQPSGVILALERGDERSMICSRGANDGIRPDRIDASAFDGATHLHISGYTFLSEAQRLTLDHVLTVAGARALSISIDPPPANLIRAHGVAGFLDRLPDGTWLFPNRTEGELLADLRNPESIVRWLSERFPVGALTLGRDGAIAWAADRRHTAAPKPIESADPTGAGDAFAGAFVAAYLAHPDIASACDAACAAARAHLAAGIPPS